MDPIDFNEQVRSATILSEKFPFATCLSGATRGSGTNAIECFRLFSLETCCSLVRFRGLCTKSPIDSWSESTIADAVTDEPNSWLATMLTIG